MVKYTAFVLGCWLVGTTLGYGQSLKLPFSVYAGSAALDLHSTYRFLQYDGLREANPIGRWMDGNPPALVATSAALDATACYALYRLWGQRHRQASRVILYSLAGVRVGLAVHNYRATNGRTLRRQW